jgi:hypothetical protein
VIESHEELEVYKLAFQAAMRILALTKVSSPGDVLPHRSDSPLIPVGVLEYR